MSEFNFQDDPIPYQKREAPKKRRTHPITWIVWDAESGEKLAALPGGVYGHRCVTFSPDGRAVAAGGEDHAVYVWELASGGVRTKLVGHEGPVTAVKFAPDSRTLYTGSSDTTILKWNLVAPPAPTDRATAWIDLRVPDAMKAHRAMRALLMSSTDTVATLSRQLKKNPPVDVASMKKWIDDLDSPKFAARETAAKELVRIGGASLPFLREASRGQSLEMTRRATQLIQTLDSLPLVGDDLFHVRALELLEQIATPEARRLVTELADGGPGHPLTEEAKSTLTRWRRKIGEPM